MGWRNVKCHSLEELYIIQGKLKADWCICAGSGGASIAVLMLGRSLLIPNQTKYFGSYNSVALL